MQNTQNITDINNRKIDKRKQDEMALFFDYQKF